MFKKPWHESDVLRFIQYYKNYEYLWNPASEFYKNKIKRHEAYLSLLNDMNIAGLTIDDVVYKIKNIRTAYGVELNKQIKSKGLYIPKLFWFKQVDAFLRNARRDRQSAPIILDNDTNKHDTSQNQIITHPSSRVESPGPSTSEAKRPRISPKIEVDIKSCDEDEFDLFGRTIALQLKQLPLDVAISLQERIQYAINKERLKILNEKNKEELTLTLVTKPTCPSDENKITSSICQRNKPATSMKPPGNHDYINSETQVQEERMISDTEAGDSANVEGPFVEEVFFKQEFPDEIVEFTETQFI